MLNHRAYQFLSLLLLLLLLAACGGQPPATPTPQPTEAPPTATEALPTENPAVTAVIRSLARQYEIAPEAVIVQSIRATEWPDTCLGVQMTGVPCAEAITPGYIIQLDVEGVVMVFHSNEDGSRSVLAFATE